jgi:glycosyltransferase involved in cell wall biosynthesis
VAATRHGPNRSSAALVPVKATHKRGYSVVICTHNRREYAAECVRSVLTQTRPPEEVIVVDDGSTDGTADYLRSKFPDVRVVRQENLGRSIAANRGVHLAEHEWICLLDDDDLWHRDKLAAVDRYLDEHPGCSALNHPVWFFRIEANGPAMTMFGFEVDFVARNLEECHAAVESGDPSNNDAGYLNIRGQSYAKLLERNRGGYSASVIRRDVFVSAGGMPPALTSADDWTLFLNVARLTEWHTLDRRLAFSRVHANQSTGEPTNATAILAAHLVVWFGGRPLPRRLAAPDIRGAMDRYEKEYRYLVQTMLWAALQDRQWRLARDVRRLARPLVQRRRNWLLVHVPPTLSDRLFRN